MNGQATSPASDRRQQEGGDGSELPDANQALKIACDSGDIGTYNDIGSTAGVLKEETAREAVLAQLRMLDWKGHISIEQVGQILDTNDPKHVELANWAQGDKPLRSDSVVRPGVDTVHYQLRCGSIEAP